MKNVHHKIKPDLTFTVREADTLQGFLQRAFAGKSRNSLKELLASGRVEVNGRSRTAYDHSLQAGDRVTVRRTASPAQFRHPKLRILFEDEWLIVVDKREGLLSIGTDKEREKTAYHILSEHIKRQNPRARLFVVHRLDRETSGVMLFAKREDVKRRLQDEWRQLVLDRRYVAVVDGVLPSEEGVIDAPLAENRNHKVYVCRETDDVDWVDAVTHYRVLKSRNGRSLVELWLETGRKNQIRAHMEYIGCPIVGDRKYGSGSDDAGRVCLHAFKLALIHPVTGEELNFSIPVPKKFDNLI